jgi:hypothetical protein
MLRKRSMLCARLLRDGEPGALPANGGTGGGGGTPPAGGAPANNQGQGQDGGEQLGEAGKAAIDRERASAREANRLKSAAEQRAEAVEAELAQLREANQSEAEKATAKAVKEATAAAVAQGNQRLVRAEVKAAAAAAGFHDARDAALLLADKFGQIKVGDDGQVDENAVKALIEDLAKDKPHLVMKPGGGNGATPLPGQGNSGTTAPNGKAAGLAEARKRFGDPAKTTT